MKKRIKKVLKTRYILHDHLAIRPNDGFTIRADLWHGFSRWEGLAIGTQFYWGSAGISWSGVLVSPGMGSKVVHLWDSRYIHHIVVMLN